MDILEVTRASWGFTGLEPVSIVDVNPFGNALIESSDGSFWRICPEELSCELVASSEQELTDVRTSEDSVQDWRMDRLVQLATATLGSPPEGRCFCLKIPAVLGGTYDADNLGTIALSELLSASGYLALQIRDLPDGAQISLEVTD